MVTQLNYYSNVDTSIIDLQNTTDASFIGTHQVSLTNYDNTSLPAIAIGSIVENNGSLFKFEDETAISGSPSDGTVYIYLVPSGDPSLGTATVTPTFTNTAPTWSDSKQGWYGTGGSANYRYLEFKLTKNSTSWYKTDTFFSKKIYIETLNANNFLETNGNRMRFKLIEIGTWNIDSTSTVDIAHGLTQSKIIMATSQVRPDSGLDYTNVSEVGGYTNVLSANIRISRGTLSGTNWDSTSMNRGYISVWYID